MTTITADTAEFATFPRAIRNLIAETIARGGEVRAEDERLFSFWLPRKMVGGSIRQRQAGVVGWYVRDGRNKISAGVHDVTDALARGYC